MTDRVKGCTVAFERDIRVDDVTSILNAIRHLRGVLDVTELLATPEDWIAQQRVRSEMRDKLWKILTD